MNRKIISVLLVSFIVLSLTGCKFNRNTRINKRNFPDAAFADYVKTFDSDNDIPGFNAFVLSDNNNVTPLEPILAILCNSVKQNAKPLIL